MSTPYLEALAIIELLLTKNNTDKYQTAMAFLKEAKAKLKTVN